MSYTGSVLSVIGWFLLLVTVMGTKPSNCPWDDLSLVNWSEPSAWPTGHVPAENEAVTIAKGQSILLDTRDIPRLLSLTIEGTLVWGDVDDIRLETSFILVNGEFHIGSEECPFEKKAVIFLYGRSNSPEYSEEFGRKFIGVENGGKLEIHGKPKKSWTKLTGSVSPSTDSCGVVFDSWREKFGEEKEEGVHVIVWNPDGSVFDLGVFATKSGEQKDVDSFVRMMDGLMSETGKVVGIAVRGSLGKPQKSLEKLYLAIEKLGGRSIRQVKPKEPYTLVASIGHPATTREDHVTRYPDKDLLQASATLVLDTRHLVFIAVSGTVAHGYKHFTRFRVISRSLAYPLLTVLDDVTSWQPGDEIVVASTDFEWTQAEVKTIVQCPDCARNQIRVDGDILSSGEFRYSHFGHVTYGVDERAEIGLLTRNIRVEGEVQESCYSNSSREKYLCDRFGMDTFGGHIKVVRGGFARIEHTELYHLGQQASKGHYPLHFHMCDEVSGQYFRNNCIRNSFSRCITVHGTDNATVNLP
ncbi:transmembrane protein 2-like [Elysia marginata]|uniref:Transmembrane protein 2-like n=1 Tax=Elysia marginata TaxID=1093978 RepID=A0AAV4G0H5_9GAST|nr:transmembrane protein 2-like [Elysia marginata]